MLACVIFRRGICQGGGEEENVFIWLIANITWGRAFSKKETKLREGQIKRRELVKSTLSPRGSQLDFKPLLV